MRKIKIKGTLERQVSLKEFSDELAKFLQPRLKQPIEFGARANKFELGDNNNRFKILISGSTDLGTAQLSYLLEQVMDVPKLDYKEPKKHGRNSKSRSTAPPKGGMGKR